MRFKDFTFSWKRGIFTAFVLVVFGIGLFAIVGSQLDMRCVQGRTASMSCGVYRGFHRVAQGYSDFWRQSVAPRCVGGNGPDDCLEPDLGIMFWTLVAAGLLIGGFSQRRNQPPTTSLGIDKNPNKV